LEIAGRRVRTPLKPASQKAIPVRLDILADRGEREKRSALAALACAKLKFATYQRLDQI